MVVASNVVPKAVIMVAKTYWPALLAVTLLTAAPTVAMADEDDEVPVEDATSEQDPEEQEPEAVDEDSDVAEDVDDDEVADAESDDGELDDDSDEELDAHDPPLDPEDEDLQADEVAGDEDLPTATTETGEDLEFSNGDDVDDSTEDTEPAAEPPSSEESEEDDVLPEDRDADGDDPRREPIADADYDDYDAPGGIATIHADPATDVTVLGNLEEGDRWSLAIGGYMRTSYTWIQDDPVHELFGRNDGFQILDARLITRAEMDNGIGAVFSLDAGSRLTRTDPDSPVEELAMRMADAYVYYSPLDFLELNAGQFKAPFDAEDLISSADLLFVHRSVANRGVQDVEGFNVDGLSQSRQVGLQARGLFPFDDEADDGPAVSYALAVANGNGPNQSMNENDRLAYYGRAGFHWGDMVSVGGAAFLNDRTFGEPPNQVDRETWGWTADVRADVEGVSLFANVVSETRSVPELEQDPETTGLGYQAQLAYEVPDIGVQPAYRFAYYDPTFRHGGDEEDDFFEHDSQIHHTLGINYNAPEYPLRLMANYTFIVHEEEGRPLDNDRLDLLLQLQW